MKYVTDELRKKVDKLKPGMAEGLLLGTLTKLEEYMNLGPVPPVRLEAILKSIHLTVDEVLQIKTQEKK